MLVHGLSKRSTWEKYAPGWQTLNKILADVELPGSQQRQI